jgi:hypothetical protein
MDYTEDRRTAEVRGSHDLSEGALSVDAQWEQEKESRLMT